MKVDKDIFKKLCLYATLKGNDYVEGCQKHCPLYENLCGKSIYEIGESELEEMNKYFTDEYYDKIKHLTYRNLVKEFLPSSLQSIVLFKHNPYEVFSVETNGNAHWDDIASFEVLESFKMK